MRLALAALLVSLCGGSVVGQPAAKAAATGPPATYGEAVRWYEKAARAGSAQAQYLLAYMLETGKGRAPDAAQAAHWYGRAAAQGHARARLRLGWLYQTGVGVTRDIRRAAALYAAAAEQGLAEAAFNLGHLYERGEDIPADPARAVAYYRQAAEEGLGKAQLNLGLLLAAKEKDRPAVKEGFLWLSLAASQSVPGAKAARDEVRAFLSTDEIEEVRQRISIRRSEAARR